MKLLLLLVGMVLVLEGLPYAAAPDSMQVWLRKLSQVEPKHLRIIGIISMVIGLILCWVVNRNLN
jgi:uncharacterized protein